jgi:hypothetical protein
MQLTKYITISFLTKHTHTNTYITPVCICISIDQQNLEYGFKVAKNYASNDASHSSTVNAKDCDNFIMRIWLIYQDSNKIAVSAIYIVMICRFKYMF